MSELPRWNAVAASSSAPKNGVGVLDYPVRKQRDWASPRWFYDYDEDRLVVGAEYDNPLQFWVCIARALASPRTWNAVLDNGDRLDDADKFGPFLSDYRALLRDSRCLGHLPDEVADGRDYRDKLLEAEDRLCQLTRDLRHDEYECDESAFRSVITREALGLAGTMVHLLDLVGVDVVREVRVPTYTRHFGQENEDALLSLL